MEVFEVKISYLRFEDRLVPSFYFGLLKQRKKSDQNYDSIGNLFDISDGEHAALPRNSDGGIRYLYGRDVKEGSINFDPVSDDSYTFLEDFKASKRCQLHDLDLLIPILGTIGKSCVYEKQRYGIVGVPRHIGILRLKDGVTSIDQYFLSCYFRNKIIRERLIGASTGNIQHLLSLGTIAQTEIALPPSSLLAKISQNEKSANKLEAKSYELILQAQALAYSKLPFDIKHVAEHRTFTVNLSQILEHDNNWSANLYRDLYTETVKLLECHPHFRLSDCYELKKGNEIGSKNYVPFSECHPSDLPFIRTSDIVNYSPDYYTDFFASPLKYDKFECSAGKVLFTKDGKIGCVGMTDEAVHCIPSSGFAIFDVNANGKSKKLTNEYLFLLLSLPEIGRYQGLMGTVVASTIPHLREKKLSNFVLPLLGNDVVEQITVLVKQSFSLKAQRLELMKKDDELMSDFVSLSY
jgi:type I restriction enzyme, S subunit